MAGTVPLLPLEEGQAENSCFLFLSVLPTFKKKSSFLFLQVTSLSILTLIRGRNASWIIHQGRGYAIQFTLSCARRLQPSWQKMQLSQSLQPVGALGQLGKEQALPCAENPFSQHGVGLGLHDGASRQLPCPISAEVPSETRQWYHWNNFRGSWGIWHSQPLSRCSNSFSTGYTAESWDGHGTIAHIMWPSHLCAAEHSAPGRTLPFYGQGCP